MCLVSAHVCTCACQATRACSLCSYFSCVDGSVPGAGTLWTPSMVPSIQRMPGARQRVTREEELSSPVGLRCDGLGDWQGVPSSQAPQGPSRCPCHPSAAPATPPGAQDPQGQGSGHGLPTPATGASDHCPWTHPCCVQMLPEQALPGAGPGLSLYSLRLSPAQGQAQPRLQAKAGRPLARCAGGSLGWDLGAPGF